MRFCGERVRPLRFCMALVVVAVVGTVAVHRDGARASHTGTTVLVGDSTPGDDGAAPHTCGDPANPCDTVQHGIDHATNGDTVVVSPGTYVENVDFRGKAIAVISEAGQDATVIDGDMAGPVVTFAGGEGTASVLDGFTLRNGRATFGGPSFGNGGGIRIDGSSPTVTDNTIINNSACVGAGIAVNLGSPLIQRNSIVGNTQAGCSGGIGGGGISVLGDSSVRIIDNVIADNILTSANGGGISLFGAGTPTISRNVISSNSASGLSPCAQGGGISMVNLSDALIVNNVVVNNVAGCGGGISWSVPSGVTGPTLVNNTIADNQAAQGSGIYAGGFDAQVRAFNNIVMASAGETSLFCDPLFEPSPPILEFNDVFSPSGTAYGGSCGDHTGTNGNISADPLFVHPSAGDYHLGPGSPAIDTGTNTGAPATDAEGDARPLDGDANGTLLTDIGADEFCLGNQCFVPTPMTTPTFTSVPSLTPTATATPSGTPRPVGGISIDPDLSALPLEASDSPELDPILWAVAAVSAIAVVLVLAGFAWYVRRRAIQ